MREARHRADGVDAQLRGQPESATLNEGHSIAAGIWAVPLRSLPLLSVVAPQAATGTTEFTVRLVDLDGRWQRANAG